MLYFHFQVLKHFEQIQLKVLKYKIDNVITAIWDHQKLCILSGMSHFDEYDKSVLEEGRVLLFTFIKLQRHIYE